MEWTFYDPATGIFTGQRFRGPRRSDVFLNTPLGTEAFPGTYDHVRQRLDLPTGEIVAYIPPAPDPASDYEWNDVSGWIPTQASVDALRRQEEIEQLEKDQQRAVRELLLDSNNVAARQRLETIEAEILALRG